jgi:hypothetical protein
MSQVLGLCEDSDDNGQLPNTASVPPLPASRMRPRDSEESPNDAHPRNETATGSAEFVVDVEYESDDSPEEALAYQAGDWAQKFKELCRYRESKGHCDFRSHDPDYAELSSWVFRMVGGKYSILTPERVKALDGIGFVWGLSRPCWEHRLSELTDYHKIHGHCNVPTKYSKNAQLGRWVATQRSQYRLQKEGRTSRMTLSRIQELEGLGFEWEWDSLGAVWEGHLSELADYRKIHGHCNVPRKYTGNAKLAWWVSQQRQLYRLRKEGKISHMTLQRIQDLESLGFEWKHGSRKKPRLDGDATRDRERADESPEHMQRTAQTQDNFSGREIRRNRVDVSFEPEESDWNGEVPFAYIPGRTEEI